MSSAINWIKNRGIHSGLQQTTNSFRMAAFVLAPFLGVWFVIKLFVPPEFGDIASAISFVSWIAYIIMLYAKAKSDAAGYIPFPQSHWFFPDGQQISFDVLVPPNGWEKIAAYDDGSMLYRVYFKDKLSVQEADRPYPDVFNRALWKLPCEWNDAFKRNGHGEFFFENLFIDHPACENIEVGVIDWDEQGGSRIPICVITGCSWYFEESRKSAGKSLPNPRDRTTTKKTIEQAIIIDIKEELREVRTRNSYLEQEAEQYSKQEPEDIKQLADQRIEAFLKRHKSIMNAGKKSVWTRLLNMRTLAIVVALLVIIVLMSHFIMGFP